MSKHVNGKDCESCAEKLGQAHPDLQKWYAWVKAQYPDCHISWSYRNAESQALAVSQQRSKLKYPDSPHNHTEEGKPCSLALDLFQIDEQGLAVFNPIFYSKLADDAVNEGYPILWGGRWKHLGDYDHFQISLN